MHTSISVSVTIAISRSTPYNPRDRNMGSTGKICDPPLPAPPPPKGQLFIDYCSLRQMAYPLTERPSINSRNVSFPVCVMASASSVQTPSSTVVTSRFLYVLWLQHSANAIFNNGNVSIPVCAMFSAGSSSTVVTSRILNVLWLQNSANTIFSNRNVLIPVCAVASAPCKRHLQQW